MNRVVRRIASIIIAGSSTLVTFAQPIPRINEYVARKFMNYCSALPREEAWLHTDRDNYISGEPVWFSAYLFDWQSSKLEGGSTTLYIEVINSSSVPVIQKKISMINGTGQGSIILPDTLSSGKYLIRAYTNWMKNFLPASCFMKNLFIYNPVSNRFLQGAPGTGSSVKPDLSVTHTGGKGFGFTVDRKPDTLVLKVTSDESFRTGNGAICYLFIDTKGNINYNEPVSLYGTTTRITLPSKLLPAGINHITLFSGSGSPLCEQLIYTPSRENSDISVNLPDRVKKRESFSAQINTGNNKPERLSISVAAFDGKEGKGGLADYMIFGSEFGYLPESINGKALKNIPESVIDQYLQSAKSRWIDWVAILSEKLPDLKYRRENEYQNLSGVLLSKETMKPDSDKYVLLSKPGKTAWFQYSKTDQKGRFSFDVPSALAGSDIVIQPNDVSQNDAISLDSQYPSVYFPAVKETITQSSVPAFIYSWSVNYQASRIYGTPLTGDTVKSVQANGSLPRFYGKPDQILVMDNYIKLPVMQEVFFELIPGVYLKNKKSEWDITVADPVDFTVYPAPPILMIDGVVVHQPALIANLDPEIVERIEIVRERYMIGDFLIYGIVNIITRNGNFSCIDLPDQDIRIAWRNEGSEYLFPALSGRNKEQAGHIPNLRTTLYWNPSLEPDMSNNFKINMQAPDFLSQFIVSIQGVNKNGKLFSVEKVFTVTK
jgi:hypothetical protein